jgi:hypothetical protein
MNSSGLDAGEMPNQHYQPSADRLDLHAMPKQHPEAVNP